MLRRFLFLVVLMVMRVVRSSTVGVTPGVFRGRPLWLVRDDLFQLSLDEVTGNKGRKFEGILEDGKFAASGKIASYGGAQSNSMVALSHIARATGKRFVYFTRPLPEFLETTLTSGPTSNYRIARKNGMEVVQVKESAVFQRLIDAEKLSTGFPPSFPLSVDVALQSEKTYWVPQGGALPEAETGCTRLAKLVAEHVKEQNAKATAASLRNKKWVLVMAAGTGTTALYTARSLRSVQGSVEVAAVPCAGSGADLMQQMRALDRVSGDCQVFPSLLEGSAPPRVFAQPYAEHLALWRELSQELKVTFDLIYAPRTLEALLASEAWQDAANTEIMLYCCGGSEGNVSQLLRYRRDGLLL